MARIDWPEPRVSSFKRLFRWVGYSISGALMAALVLGFVGVVYQASGIQRDLKDYPPPGQLVNVGGFALHAQVLGEGSPAVVFDAGSGGCSLDWSLVAPEAARLTQVVTYDRAGMGWSDPGPMPRTSDKIVQELRTLLDNLGIDGPYILVGHSFGGFNMRLFYHYFPELVAGIVLVDAAHEDQMEPFPAGVAAIQKWENLAMRGLGVASHLGVTRASDWWHEAVLSPAIQELPDDIKDLYATFYARPKYFQTLVSETAWFRKNAAQLRTDLGSMGNLPLAVISSAGAMGPRSEPADMPAKAVNDVWRESPADLVTLSTRARPIAPENSVNIEWPDPVVAAIKAMVDNYRLEGLFFGESGT